MFASTSQGEPRKPPLPVEITARARPVSMAAARLLPLPTALAPLFPDRALRRGGTVLVAGASWGGSTTLALALLSAVSATGGWCAAVGVADPGVVAAAELGLDLRRVMFVPRPAGAWADATGELLGSVDAVVVRPPGTARPVAARRLTARARERRTALVVLAERAAGWPLGPDVTLTVTGAEWHGVGRGHGRLQGRRVVVATACRHPSGPAASHRLWLPSPDGSVGEDVPGPDGSVGEDVPGPGGSAGGDVPAPV
jgi:hypothetical protein